jgi:Phage P22-like portal protein
VTEDKKTTFSKDEQEKILALAKKRYQKSLDADNHNRVEALEMLKFKHGIDQWTKEEQDKRKAAGRPCLKINELPKFSQQVCGEMRKNKVQIKVNPADQDASQENANLRAGIIKNIEYSSNSDSIYDHAGKMIVDCGYGGWRVLSRYTENDPFVMELFMERVDNPFCIHPDPDSKDQFYADGQYLFIDSYMPRDEFIKAFSEEDLPGGLSGDAAVGTEEEHWYDNENVVIREYFYKEYTKKTMCLLSDGQKLEKKEAEKLISGFQTTFEQAKAAQEQRSAAALAAGQKFDEVLADNSGIPEIVKTREIEVPLVKWLKITADKILEENTWPGTLIPVVLVTGEYTNIGGKKYYNGMFKHAKDPQRMLNNTYTSLWETIALMPKAPWQASAKMIEGYEDDYLAANAENFPVLKFKKDSDFPGEKPQRSFPNAAPQALFAQLSECKNDIKDAIGMYNVDLGDRGREMSGRAILAHQATGDTSTFTYPDNLSGGIAYGGKILNDALGYFYDTERDIRMRSVDGKDSFAPINTTVGKAIKSIDKNPQKYVGMDKKRLSKALKKDGPAGSFNDITKGKYDIVISTGPAYATQRMEAAENMIKIAQFSGNMNPVDKHFIITNLDFPGAQEWSEAVRKQIPEGLLPPKEDEEPTPPKQSTPEQMEAQLKLQLDMEKIKVEKMKLQLETLKVQNELAQTQDAMRSVALDTLGEAMAPAHPADGPMPEQGE